MIKLIALMEKKGERFEMPVGDFPDIAQAAEWIKKYSDELDALEYRIVVGQ